MTHQINLVEVYCEGSPSTPQDRESVARMVRTVRKDDRTVWAIARADGHRHRADDQGRDRFDLRCHKCRISAQVVVDETRATRAYLHLAQGLDAAAVAGLSELSLHAIAGIVSR